MCLADSGWPEQDDVLLAFEEAELVQTLDLLAMDRRLKREVKLLERLDRRQSRRAHRRLHTTVVAQSDLSVEQLMNGF